MPLTADEMGPVHYIVMYWAVDGGPLISPLQGLDEGIESGEYFVIFDPQPLEAVRQATIDIVEAGYGELRSAAPDEDKTFPASEALHLLRDPSTWTGDHYYELAATEAGVAAFRSLHERHGDYVRKAERVARQRSAEFRQRHPDFESKQSKYFDDVSRWSKTGEGERPEFPRYLGEPPAYDDDVRRSDRKKDQ
jgi:hypothetical protein